MIESILEEPLALTRHRAAPLLREREQFLAHLLRQGTSHRRVRSVAAYLIHIVRILELTNLRNVEVEEIKKAGECWANYQGPHRRRKAGKTAAYCFTGVARNWLRFHGRLTVPIAPAHPFGEFVSDFIESMRSTQGLSPYTIQGYGARARVFLNWIASRHEALSSVSLHDVDDFLAVKAADGWCPRTLATQGQALRAFFGTRRIEVGARQGSVGGSEASPFRNMTASSKGQLGRKSGYCSVMQVGRSQRRSGRGPSYRCVRSMHSAVVKSCDCA